MLRAKEAFDTVCENPRFPSICIYRENPLAFTIGCSNSSYCAKRPYGHSGAYLQQETNLAGMKLHFKEGGLVK